MPAGEPLVTVVVPTRGRPAALRRCLAALAADPTAPAHEVVVVDDAPGARRIGAGAPGGRVGVRVVRTGGRGPAAARNAGARAARTALLAFTDDDCEPRRGWLAALVAALGHADVAGGRTCNAVPGCVPAEASQRLSDALLGLWNTTPAGPQFFPTNNVACRAEVLDAVPFDERFPAAAGEDRDWCARLVGAGLRLRPVPDAVVAHHGPQSLAAFLRQQWRYGTGAWHARGGDGPAAVGVRSPRFYAHVVAAAREAPSRRPAVAALLIAAQAATAAGAFHGAVRDRKEPRP